MNKQLSRLPALYLSGCGVASCVLYTGIVTHGDYRPGRMSDFFPAFFTAFTIYLSAVWLVLRVRAWPRWALPLIIGFAFLFNLILLPATPNLSDDMYRYVWDGRVQAQGINPYRYASDAPELDSLRDDAIWDKMNRKSAHTIYPPAAQLTFATLWRIAPNSVLAFKLAFVMASLFAGVLLIPVLRGFGQSPELILAFLWSPLLIIEVAHSAHADALYLPLLVGVFWLRLRQSERGSWKTEAGIGVLLGLATLIKLYPAILAVALWSLRDAQGRRRLRLAFPIAMLLTIAAGYSLYAAPGVDLLGFLPSYGREFFNIAPLSHWLINLATAYGQPYWAFVNPTLFVLVFLVSISYILFPARSPQRAILRCMIPIALYLLVNMNLFPWYMLFMLPLIPMALTSGRWFGFRLNAAFAWLIFTGLVMISYDLFVTGFAQAWEVPAQFIPLYVLLGLGALIPFGMKLYSRFQKGTIK